MANLLKAMLGSSSQKQSYDPKLTQRVRPNAHDPTLAWDRLKVKQIVKRLVDYPPISMYIFHFIVMKGG